MLFIKSFLKTSTHHLNKPNQSLVGEANPMAIKWSVHAGYKFYFKEGVMGEGMFSTAQERSLTPTVQYKKQGVFDQLDIGMYYTFEPMIFGLWYRGMPFLQSNHESVVFLLGYSKKGKDDILNIGYSYDITISKLTNASGGSHEFSISYAWFTGDPRKPPKHVRMVPCPDF